jgi:hypothetical protein
VAVTQAKTGENLFTGVNDNGDKITAGVVVSDYLVDASESGRGF